MDEERGKDAIRDHWEQEMSNAKQEMKSETKRQICLGIIGVTFITIWFFLSATVESVWMEILSIMGWVAVWEATSIAIMRKPELHLRKKIYERASKAEILFDIKDSSEE